MVGTKMSAILFKLNNIIMAETYHFNTHNVKTEELNSKIIIIWPRY